MSPLLAPFFNPSILSSWILRRSGNSPDNLPVHLFSPFRDIPAGREVVRTNLGWAVRGSTHGSLARGLLRDIDALQFRHARLWPGTRSRPFNESLRFTPLVQLASRRPLQAPLAATHRQEQALGQSCSDDIDLIDTARLPDGALLRLLRCGDQFSIELNSEELMGNTDHVSEEALATIVAERLPSLAGSVLIGGLGMGFTLGATLEAWDAEARICVAELVPEVLEWANGPLAHIFGGKLSDPRVTVLLADVHDVIGKAGTRYDTILLDVDNGPDWFVQKANQRLYDKKGLNAARMALNDGGILAVWSAYPDADFVARLRDAGFAVEEVQVPAFEGARTEKHHIWLASADG